MAGFQSSYRPPVLITDLIRFPVSSPSYFQQFHSTSRGTNTVEVYFREPEFLITAGGNFEHGGGFANDFAAFVDGLSLGFTHLSDGESLWPQPTSLMPTREGADVNDFVRIRGSSDPKERRNNCVAPGFACGLNPQLPLGLPEKCQDRRGNWTFVNFDANTADCPFQLGFWVAFYSQRCGGDDDCKDAAGSDDGSFGFFEATPALRVYNDYIDAVMSLNQNWKYEYRKDNLFVSPRYGSTTFRLYGGAGKWQVLSYGPLGASVKPERIFEKWNVASGGVISSPRRYCLHIDNRRIHQRLILDGTDYKRPRRAIVDVPSECDCPLSDSCLNLRAR